MFARATHFSIGSNCNGEIYHNRLEFSPSLLDARKRYSYCRSDIDLRWLGSIQVLFLCGLSTLSTVANDRQLFYFFFFFFFVISSNQIELEEKKTSSWIHKQYILSIHLETYRETNNNENSNKCCRKNNTSNHHKLRIIKNCMTYIEELF